MDKKLKHIIWNKDTGQFEDVYFSKKDRLWNNWNRSKYTSNHNQVFYALTKYANPTSLVVTVTDKVKKESKLNSSEFSTCMIDFIRDGIIKLTRRTKKRNIFKPEKYRLMLNI